MNTAELRTHDLLGGVPSGSTDIPDTRLRAPLLVLAMFFLLARPLVAGEPVEVSLIQLIANPQAYQGKIVRVIGFVRLEFEGEAIYLHRDDYEHDITKNGLWIDISDALRKKRTQYDQRYVLLEGSFNANEKGHKGAWSGSIQRITRFDVWGKDDDRK